MVARGTSPVIGGLGFSVPPARPQGGLEVGEQLKIHSGRGGLVEGTEVPHLFLHPLPCASQFFKVFFKSSLSFYDAFPSSSVGKQSACNARDLGSIPGLGRSPGEGNGVGEGRLQPTPVLLPGDSMNRGTWSSPWDRKESDMTLRLTFFIMSL